MAAALLTLSACSGNKPIGASGATGTPSPTARASSASAVPLANLNSAPPGIDFGDDSSRFARDGECDDKRFAGAGMTNTPLLDSDIGHDATDCRSAYEQHRLTYSGPNPGAPSPSGTYAASGVNHIMWGDDNGRFARDGECDDKRFTGPGMTDTPLLDSDIKHDAADCRAAYEQGRLTLRD